MARARPRTGWITGDYAEREVVQLWRESYRSETTIRQYLHWVRRFRAHCHAFGLSELEQLTRRGVDEFARRYRSPRLRRPSPVVVRASARSALHAWSYAVHKLGRELPEWLPPATPEPLAPLIVEYAAYRKRYRGVADGTLISDVAVTKGFLAALKSRRRSAAQARVSDVDWFVTRLAHRFSKRTVAGTCSSLRAFLRFLHATGRLDHDLAGLVMAPRVRRVDRPPRALPWNDVRRMLRSIRQDGPVARRDYAVLLLMATYGLGAAEVVALSIEDIDWATAVLRVRRPKTGIRIVLPLLPPVARAIATYLRRARPRQLTTRAVFVSPGMPHRPLSSGAIRHLVRHRAREAGISVAILGGHVLRHSHATRQIDMGANPKVVGDILGHGRPASTSIYIRVALRRLCGVGLPVPR
jgi:integrase/recombinase XerD